MTKIVEKRVVQFKLTAYRLRNLLYELVPTEVVVEFGPDEGDGLVPLRMTVGGVEFGIIEK